MIKNQRLMHKFGLVGKNIAYSFSKKYFTAKFEEMALDDYMYYNFDIQTIADFPTIITENLMGLNVTIPYKEQVIPFLDEIDHIAAKIGAVNTIKIKNNKLKGFNTDAYGFENSIKTILKENHKNALVLGSGGASKAVIYVLEKLKIDYLIVSRKPSVNEISYQQITSKIMENNTIIINCTPLGTYPESERCPNIPYQYVTDKHLLFDLIYNPSKTKFLLEGEIQGAAISNGLKMLRLQADRSWEIWNNNLF